MKGREKSTSPLLAGDINRCVAHCILDSFGPLYHVPAHLMFDPLCGLDTQVITSSVLHIEKAQILHPQQGVFPAERE